MVKSMLANRRKAYASRGDDATLTRFIKEPGYHMSGRKTAEVAENATSTRFPKRVLRIDQMTNLLVSGHSNIKIGRDVRKGHLQGYWIYTLSLEERATCPRSCQHWANCYGNALPFAKRIDHTDPKFLLALEAEIADLCKRKKGVLIRLHALGDFYSLDYIDFWEQMLVRHPNLAIYGYTAHSPFRRMGEQIKYLNREFGARCMIRFSNGGISEMSTVTIGSEASCPVDAFVCPEQTGRTKACATCGACWTTKKTVAFLEH